MIDQDTSARRGRRLLTSAFVFLALVTLMAMAATAQSFPRCISGCTANDVELVEVTADVLGSCTPGGAVDADLYVSLYFNRNKTYCVRFVADIYIDGELAIADMVSEPLNVFSKGAYPDIYFGSVSLPCGSSLSLENVQIMWSVDQNFKNVSECVDGSCAPYGPGSKCTGDQYGTIFISLPLDALDDTGETDEDTPVIIDLLANDLLGVEPTHIVELVSGAHGSTQDNGDGTVTYTPDPDYHGIDTFTYALEDSDGNVDSAVVSVTIYPANDGPMALNDHSETDENESVRIDILGNDSDPDGSIDSSSVSIIQDPIHGTVDVDPATGVVTYSPSNGDCGSDSFSYVVEDNEGAISNEATVDIEIQCNESPTAADDYATTDENTAIEINVSSNDEDSDGFLDLSSIQITNSPSFGTLSVHHTSGLVTYMPDPLSCGDDSFSYTIADDDGAISNEAHVTIAVMCDDPPLAIDDLYHVSEGETLHVNAPGIIDNDIASPGDPLIVTLISGVSHGDLTLDANGSFTYVHDGSETTSDQFTYYVSSDTKDSNIATVTLIIQPVNDAPTAVDDEDSTAEDIPVTIDVLSNDSDPDGDLLSVDWVGQAKNGSVSNNGGTVTYTPDPNSHGTDSFSYAATDGNGGQATATVTVFVSPVNDPPVAQDDSESTDEDTPVLVDVLNNDSDPDGDTLIIQSVTQPNNGIVENNGSDITYIPDPDSHGMDTFTYTLADGNGGTSLALVTVAVDEINDAPIALDDGATTPEDTSVDIDVLSNDFDPDSDSLVVESVTQAEHGEVVNNGTDVTYIPNPNFNGEDAFTYTACDENGGKATATVYVTVLPSNDPPVAQDDSGNTQEDTPITLDVALTVQSVTQPDNGSVITNGDVVIYTPNLDFNGIDTFTYVLSDGNGGTATATVTITVSAVNDPPIAEDDEESTNEESPVSIDVLLNDSDPDGNALIIEAVTSPEHGSVDNYGTSLTYTPDPDFNGTETLTYSVSDGNGGTDTATVVINVNPINDAPLAQDDSAITDEDTLVSIPVLSNDSDPDGDFLLVKSVSSPSNGTIINAETSISYIPNPGFNGIDVFTYTISDGNGGTDTATVTVAISAVNDPPTALDDSETTDEDTPVSIGVLLNDSDLDGDTLVIQSLTQPSNGSTVKDGETIAYTPLPGFNGVDTFTYTISDGNGGTDTATVTVAVAAVNDPPVAQDDSDSTDENTPVVINVLPNDSDPDGENLIVQSVTQSNNGSVVNNGTDVTYTPDSGFSGIDVFTYTISDSNGETATATVTVAIAAVNDPPVAQDDSDSTDENTPVVIDVLPNDSDPDGDSLIVESVTQAEHGEVVNNGTDVVYTPDPGFDGVDLFTYTISDGNGETATATVTVAVAAVNDPPIAQDDSDSTDEGTPVVIDVLPNDSDPDGDNFSIQSVTPPANGTVVNNGTDIVYTPNPDFNGVDVFTYTISDGNGETATATVTIAVAAINDPPTALDDGVITGEDAAVTILVLQNDSDPEGDILSVESVTQPLHGAVVSNGTSIIYTPAPDYVGLDSFSYTVSDGNGGTSTAVVSINVLPINDPPVAQDDSQTTRENAPVTVLVLSNDSDPDGDPLRVESIEQPLNGSVVNTGSELVYEPNPGYSGTDSFTYTVADDRGGTSTARVNILVNTLNDPPIAQNDSASTNEETLVVIPILANDSDPDGDFLLIESFTQPANGSVLNSRTNLSYIPDPGFQGIDTFMYTVSDGNGGSSQATVTVSVAEVNEAPIAQDDSGITDEGNPVAILTLLNDSDPDGDPLEIESVTTPDNGLVEIVGDELVYTPNPGFDGVDTFTYTISDGRGGTSSATVFIAVTPVNDAPLAQDDSTTTIQGEIISVPVLLNDSDPDGDPLVIVSVTQPQNGSVTIVGTDLLYEPDDGFIGPDSFTYTIADDSGAISSATVTIGIDPLIAGAGAAADNAASCEGRVIINEIAWAGTAADARDEWIELRNLGTTPVDLTGWVLRWRSTHASTPEDQIWKVIELEGILPAANEAACDSYIRDENAGVRVESLNGATWLITADPDTSGTGYYVLERRTNNTIQDIQASQIYDANRTLSLELSDLGEIVMLVNKNEEVVDTANASNLGRNGWVAGSTTTRGSMERIDPLKPDTADNWQTNFGLVIVGNDAAGHPLRATPGITNSPHLGTIGAIASIPPISIRAGEVLQADFSLTRQDRRIAGWPWISVIRPGFTGISGAGGAVDYTSYAFSGSYQSDSQYALEIATSNLSTGSYSFWIIYASGKAVYVPTIVSP
jgi:VCBS repeat-containing protein